MAETAEEERRKDYWVGAQLERELRQKCPDAAKVRSFVQQRPGACLTDEMRRKVWLCLLGGPAGRSEPVDDQELAAFPQKRTLDADVPRTRADVELFRSDTTRELLERVLIRFCRSQRLSYKQGLNELLAPVLYLVMRCRAEAANNEQERRRARRRRLRAMAEAVGESRDSAPSYDSETPQNSPMVSPVKHVEVPVEDEVYTLFERFMRSFCLWFYNDPDFRILQLCIHIFRLLLQYHDPSVARALERNHLTPELYAMPWAMTMFARDIELSQVLILWDWMVADKDPALWLYLGIALLLRHREETLTQEASELPGRLHQYQLGPPDQMHELMRSAIEIRQNTPWTTKTQLRRILRHPAPPQRTLVQIEEVLGRYACLVVTPKELLRSLDRGGANPGSAAPAAPEGKEGKEGDTTEVQHDEDLDLVAIDVRPLEVGIESGAGSFAKGTTLGQEAMSTEIFSVWLDHFDAVRGCHICVLGTDHLVVRADAESKTQHYERDADGNLVPRTQRRPSSGLWRRLVLGEGDDVDADEWDGVRYGFSRDKSIRFGLPMDPRGANRCAALGKELLDDGGGDDEEEIDPTMQFALCLIRRGFLRVSICHGGMFECIQELRRQRSAVDGREPEALEPLVIGYDCTKWESWVHQRSHFHSRYAAYREQHPQESDRSAEARRILSTALSTEFTSDSFDGETIQVGSPEREVSRIRAAAVSARRAGHKNVLVFLSIRVGDLVAAGEISEADEICELVEWPRVSSITPGKKKALEFFPSAEITDRVNRTQEVEEGERKSIRDTDIRMCRTAVETASHGQHLYVLPFLAQRLAMARLVARYYQLDEEVRRWESRDIGEAADLAT